MVFEILQPEPVTDFSVQDQDWMRHALRLASTAASFGEVPVGAVLVHANQIIGQGYNCPIHQSDPTAHAEIQAIRDACQRLKNYRLPDQTTLYVTLEPCTQCVGALVHARVQRVVFAATEPRAGSLVSARCLMQQGFYNHYFDYAGGLLAEESSQLLRQFFKQRRQTKQQTAILPIQPIGE
ncbi:MAG: tRNA adenosine(34) deaminase TadA [Pseudomonadota bacterium]|nr:tRNA adenosine(34) deaminase TadA [Pseudomonadota bacterium]